VKALIDYSGREIRLTDERASHILEHSEMVGQESKIDETLLVPDIVITSKYDATVHLYHKFYHRTPVSEKFLMVAVKILDDDAFVITAFFIDKIKRGERIWPR